MALFETEVKMACLLFAMPCSGRTVVWRWFPYQAPTTEALAFRLNVFETHRQVGVPVSKDPEVVVAAERLDFVLMLRHGSMMEKLRCESNVRRLKVRT